MLASGESCLHEIGYMLVIWSSPANVSLEIDTQLRSVLSHCHNYILEGCKRAAVSALRHQLGAKDICYEISARIAL